MFVQTMNILIMNQSVMDMCASFFTLLVAVVEVDATGMSRDSVYDRLVCHVWLSKLPLWNFLIMSSYNIALTAIERFLAVVYPVWFNNNVRTCLSMPLVILPNVTSTRRLIDACYSTSVSGWLRGPAVKHWSLADVLSLSCARLVADG